MLTTYLRHYQIIINITNFLKNVFTEFMRLLLVISATAGLNLRTINPMWECLVGTVKNDSIACHICDICLGGMNITIFENYVKNSEMGWKWCTECEVPHMLVLIPKKWQKSQKRNRSEMWSSIFRLGWNISFLKWQQYCYTWFRDSSLSFNFKKWVPLPIYKAYWCDSHNDFGGSIVVTKKMIIYEIK